MKVRAPYVMSALALRPCHDVPPLVPAATLATDAIASNRVDGMVVCFGGPAGVYMAMSSL